MRFYLLVSNLLIIVWRTTDLTLADEEAYFLNVDHSYYLDTVLHRNDSWILIFYRDKIDKSWETLAKSIRGLAWMGKVDVRGETKLVKDLKLDPSNLPAARVYPFGSSKQKLSGWQDVSDWREAERFALKSIPADIPVLSSETIHGFITDSHQSTPPRFPALLLTASREVTPTFRAIKERFRRYFNLGMMLNAKDTELEKLGFDTKKSRSFPALAIIIQRKQVSEKPKRKPQKPPSWKDRNAKLNEKPKDVYVTSFIEYQKDKFGEFSYASIMKFFFSVNHQLRYTLPEVKDTKQAKTVAMMEDVMDIEQDRFDELFDRKRVSKTQREQKDSDVKKTLNETETVSGERTGGKCPFGFDKLSQNSKENVKPKKQMQKTEL